jgi:uncharacterized protein
VNPSEALHVQHLDIWRVVESHRARNSRVFGLVVQGSVTYMSDLDLLVDPLPEMTHFNIGAIRHELTKLLGFLVDVLTPWSVPDRVLALVVAEAQDVARSLNQH